MQDHKLYGRKTPGKYTTMLNNGSEQVWDELTLDDENSYAEGFMNGIEDVTTAGVGAGAFVGGAVAGGAKKAGSSAVDGTQNFNGWAQGLSDPETGVYPYTRFNDVDW